MALWAGRREVKSIQDRTDGLVPAHEAVTVA
jgi:hypothetical protein